VNQTDVQRIIRACQREKVPFKVTLQPDGAAVFEQVTAPATEEPRTALDKWMAEHAREA
jgi:hypothetical protein